MAKVTDISEKGLESQKRAISQYPKGHGIKGATWYTDRVSGVALKSPKLETLKKDLFNGQIKTVIVWALDRLTRQGPRDGLELLSRWMKKGVRVVSVTEQLDFGDDSGGDAGVTFTRYCTHGSRRSDWKPH